MPGSISCQYLCLTHAAAKNALIFVSFGMQRFSNARGELSDLDECWDERFIIMPS